MNAQARKTVLRRNQLYVSLINLIFAVRLLRRLDTQAHKAIRGLPANAPSNLQPVSEHRTGTSSRRPSTTSTSMKPLNSESAMELYARSISNIQVARPREILGKRGTTINPSGVNGVRIKKMVDSDSGESGLPVDHANSCPFLHSLRDIIFVLILSCSSHQPPK